ncbi:hypothetical protein GCM10027408_23400 [Microbacterium tumbae]
MQAVVSTGMEHAELVRLYGPWRPRSPRDVAAFFRGYPGPWWIAGGWAIEAFTGIHRPHGDIDPSIPRADVALLQAQTMGLFDVWAADKGTLTPLIGSRAQQPSTCSNLWLRRDGAAPWEYDVILMDIVDDVWTYKRDSRIALPVDEILWDHEGLRWLRPEVQLLHKAPGLRPQDRQDFDSAAPLLDTVAREWLREAMELAHPGHPWIAALAL